MTQIGKQYPGQNQGLSEVGKGGIYRWDGGAAAKAGLRELITAISGGTGAALSEKAEQKESSALGRVLPGRMLDPLLAVNSVSPT
jgi:hypothetical protein